MNTIETLHKEWQRFQPLTLENQQRLDRKFMLEFNYNSNHLEGNTLSYGQTKLLLMFGETSGDAKLRDYEEMKAHNVGLELVKREAKDKERPLTESFIRELNRTILVENFRKIHPKSGTYEIHVGIYKTRPNSVITATGEMFDYASPEETPALMTDLVDWYNTEEKKGELCPLQLATLFHYRYIRIHPFEDGNGRIARLLVNYILLRHDYPMVIVPSKDKERYLQALHRSDIEVGLNPSDGANASLEQIEPFLEYQEEQLKHALEISIKAAKGENIEEEDDFTKRLALLEREAKQKAEVQQAKPKRNSDQIWNVLEFFYYPITKGIDEALQPSNKFFSQVSGGNLISKTEAQAGGLHLNSVMRDTKNSQIIEFVSEARSMFYYYELKYPKQEYGMGNLSIEISFNIQFNDDHYTISCMGDRKFSYEFYPSGKEVEKIVSDFKNQVLKQIEEAIHNAK
jgi:Fic family protein